MSLGRLLLLALIVQLSGLRTSFAYKFEPISRVFAPSGSKATQSFEVINDGKERIALTVSILTLERDDAYVETNHDADDDFLIYPPQMVVSPGKRQTVRVTWLGDAKPARERTFRIAVQQVSIHTLDKAAPPDNVQGHVKVLLNYRGTLFVRPAGARPQITADVVADVAKKQLALTLTNRGNAVGTARSCSIKLQLAGGAVLDVPASSLAEIKNHRVLAGGRRRYAIAWPSTLRTAPLKAVGQCVVQP